LPKKNGQSQSKKGRRKKNLDTSVQWESGHTHRGVEKERGGARNHELVRWKGPGCHNNHSIVTGRGQRKNPSTVKKSSGTKLNQATSEKGQRARVGEWRKSENKGEKEEMLLLSGIR